MMTNSLSFQEKYEAMGRKDAAFEGAFITAVKTTGIFCRPTCRAKKPNPENVVFYETTQQALQHGFRPCKICKPLEPLEETPHSIQEIIKDLHQDPFLRLKDEDLRQRDIDPIHMRRWFQKHHNITFQGYQRLLRVNTAFKSIQQGNSVTRAAFDSGYESLSSFNEGYRALFGAAPTDNTPQNVLTIVRFTTPIGPMFACASSKGLCLLEFTDRKMLETEFKDLRHRLQAVILPGNNPHLTHVQQELKEYFEGTRTDFTAPLDTPGTDFRQSVWKVLQEIPYGETWSYQQQADALNKSKAVRAVASANGHNRISIIIPCHRVIGSDGTLTGYGGGLHRKQWLIDFEKKHKK